jgi:hypothetical protein
MNKVVRNGLVAVLYSPRYGAGWYSWNYDRGFDSLELVFDPGLVSLVEQGDQEKILAYATLKWPDAYLGGLDDIQIRWIPQGTAFRIEEYDGSESISFMDDIDWIKA